MILSFKMPLPIQLLAQWVFLLEASCSQTQRLKTSAVWTFLAVVYTLLRI